MDALQQALLIFSVGAVVTASTTAMIMRGHLLWRDRDPWEQR